MNKNVGSKLISKLRHHKENSYSEYGACGSETGFFMFSWENVSCEKCLEHRPKDIEISLDGKKLSGFTIGNKGIKLNPDNKNPRIPATFKLNHRGKEFEITADINATKEFIEFLESHNIGARNE